MRIITIKTPLIALASVGLLAAAAPAYAGCGTEMFKQPAAWQAPSSGNPFHQADYGLRQVDYGASSIVGMWSFKFIAGGATVDFGYTQWHADGTELMNSGGRAPATENFCMGVWKETSPSHYHLNHFALSYDSTGALNAKVNIKEDVVVDARGTSYSGPFTIDVYDPNTGQLLQHLGGQVTAQRVAAY